jgi:hypothetical protein
VKHQEFTMKNIWGDLTDTFMPFRLMLMQIIQAQ